MDLKNSVFVMGNAYTNSPTGVMSYPSANIPVTKTIKIDDGKYQFSLEQRKKYIYYKPFIFEFKKVLTIKIEKVSLQIGNIIDFITRYTGIKKLIVWLTKGNCGCEARRIKFNNLFYIKLPLIQFLNLSYGDNIDYQKYLEQQEYENYVTNLHKQEKTFQENKKKKQEFFDNMYADKITENMKSETTNTSNLATVPQNTVSPPSPKAPKKGGCGCGAKKQLTKKVNVV